MSLGGGAERFLRFGARAKRHQPVSVEIAANNGRAISGVSLTPSFAPQHDEGRPVASAVVVLKRAPRPSRLTPHDDPMLIFLRRWKRSTSPIGPSCAQRSVEHISTSMSVRSLAWISRDAWIQQMGIEN